MRLLLDGFQALCPPSPVSSVKYVCLKANMKLATVILRIGIQGIAASEAFASVMAVGGILGHGLPNTKRQYSLLVNHPQTGTHLRDSITNLRCCSFAKVERTIIGCKTLHDLMNPSPLH